jgi:arylsulfatase
MWTFVPAQEIVGRFLATFKDYPQRMPIASLSVDEVLKRLQGSQGN